jgi:hypothetical protein
MFGEFFNKGFLHIGAHFGYFGGLAALVPVLTGALKLDRAPWSVFPPTFWIAIGIVLVSIILIFILKKGLGEGLIAMGIMTIIPGVLSLLFSVISQEQVFAAINQKITGFHVVAPVFSFFVEHSVPKMAYIAILYIVGGYFIWKIGLKLKSGF